MTEVPAVGRIVHYYEGDQEEPMKSYGGDWPGTNGTRIHPAIITRVFSDDCLNLQVFFDTKGTQVRSSVLRQPAEMIENGYRIGSSGWRWPERK
jgi:hypothetical protein